MGAPQVLTTQLQMQTCNTCIARTYALAANNFFNPKPFKDLIVAYHWLRGNRKNKHTAKQNKRKMDKRSLLAALELAERPFKLFFNEYLEALEKYIESNPGTKTHPDLNAFLKKHKLSRRFANRLQQTSLAKIPDEHMQRSVEIDQTPAESNPNTWTMRIVVRDVGFQTDLMAYKKFVEILLPEDQDAATAEFQMRVNTLFSSIAMVYDYLKQDNHILEYFRLMIDQASGTFTFQVIDYPEFNHPRVLGVEILPSRSNGI